MSRYVDLLMIAVDNGKDKMVYAGPVQSHYEFEMPGVARKSDSEWRNDIKIGNVPPRPDWTKSYLVPLTPEEIIQREFDDEESLFWALVARYNRT